MKVVGKTGSGKTTFVSAFIHFLLKYIDNIENIFLLSPTSNQGGWDTVRKNITHLTDINEIIDAKNSIVVCDNMQTKLRGNKVLTKMILNKRQKFINNSVWTIHSINWSSSKNECWLFCIN